MLSSVRTIAPSSRCLWYGSETRQRLTELEAVNRISTALRVAQTAEQMLPVLVSQSPMGAQVNNSMVYHQPVGVCGLIPTWNFPLFVTAQKIGPALATGCTMVIKPSPYAPLIDLLIAEVIEDCDLPKGVFNVVTGESPELGAERVGPDVILMDISMPKQDGLAVTQALRQVAPRVKVLVLSAQNNRESIFRIIQAGAQGYVSKNASPKELLEAIESVYNGQAFFTPEVAQAALNHLVNQGGKTECTSVLTEREREVLVLIAEGKSNKEIACQLNIGVRTIETHRERIMRRLDIHSVAGLTRFAIAKGLVSLESPTDNRSHV